MAEILPTAFKHHLWANLRLLDTCDGLGEEAVDDPLKGTYGSVRDTMLHLCAAEERYVATVTGEDPAQPIREGDFPGWAELKLRAGASGRALLTIAEGPAQDRTIEGVHPRFGKFALPLSVFLAQAINHATEHRAHVCTILTQKRVEPPVLDVWAWAAEARGGS
jgi:uncharacterized damage-inducible protein DinB